MDIWPVDVWPVDFLLVDIWPVTFLRGRTNDFFIG